MIVKKFNSSFPYKIHKRFSTFKIPEMNYNFNDLPLNLLWSNIIDYHKIESTKIIPRLFLKSSDKL